MLGGGAEGRRGTLNIQIVATSIVDTSTKCYDGEFHDSLQECKRTGVEVLTTLLLQISFISPRNIASTKETFRGCYLLLEILSRVLGARFMTFGSNSCTEKRYTCRV